LPAIEIRTVYRVRGLFASCCKAARSTVLSFPFNPNLFVAILFAASLFAASLLVAILFVDIFASAAPATNKEATAIRHADLRIFHSLKETERG
jgi:hypothetical protein